MRLVVTQIFLDELGPDPAPLPKLIGVLFFAAVVAVLVVVCLVVHIAVQGTRPEDRSEILRATADLVRAFTWPWFPPPIESRGQPTAAAAEVPRQPDSAIVPDSTGVEPGAGPVIAGSPIADEAGADSNV